MRIDPDGREFKQFDRFPEPAKVGSEDGQEALRVMSNALIDFYQQFSLRFRMIRFGGERG